MTATLAACAVLRDDAAYLAEWLSFHKLVGVEFFVLYDAGGGDRPGDVAAAVLAPDDYVVVERRGDRPSLYRHCLDTYGGRARWFAFLDAEDFLFSPGRDDIRPLLAEFEAHPAIAVNRIPYGSSGHDAPPRGLVTRNYTRRCHSGLAIRTPDRLKRPDLDPERIENYHPVCAEYRAIVQPALTRACRTPSLFAYDGDRPAVDELSRPVAGPWTEGVSVGRLRINQYWSRSRQELKRKFLRDWEDGDTPPFSQYQQFEQVLDRTADTSILPLAHRLAEPAAAPPGPPGDEDRIARWLAAEQPRKLHVGAGRAVLRGWLNTDLEPADPRLIHLDLLKPFPFPDGSLDYIFGEHVIEHFTHADGRRILTECRRVLKPGGRLRLATPDLTRFMALLAGPRDAVADAYVAWVCRSQERPHPTFAINAIFYGYGHRFLYDPELFADQVTRSGFIDVSFHRPGQSGDAALRGLESHGRLMGNEAFNDLETMIVEAAKPL